MIGIKTVALQLLHLEHTHESMTDLPFSWWPKQVLIILETFATDSPRFDVTLQAEQDNNNTNNMFSNRSSGMVTLWEVLAFDKQTVPVGKDGHTILCRKTREQIKGTINDIGSNLP